MRLLVIEDDLEFYSVMLLHISAMTGDIFETILHASTLGEARKLLQTEKPEIILFDVHLPDGIAFVHAAEWLLGEEPVLLCMTGKHADYAMYRAAFQVGAIDFLLKDEDFLSNMGFALRRAIEKVGNQLQRMYFYEDLWNKSEYDDGTDTFPVFSLNIRNNGRNTTLLLASETIVSVEAAEKKLVFSLKDGSEQESGSTTLTMLEEELPKTWFVRCHASFIVNMACIASFSAAEIVLTNGKRVPISRRNKDDVRDAIGDFLHRSRKKSR